MGILDGIVGKVQSDLEWKAGQAITDTVVKGAGGVLNKGGSSAPVNSCPKCKKECKKCDVEFPTGTNFCTGCGGKLK